MSDKLIFYNSKNYIYQPQIKVKVMSMSKASRTNCNVIQEVLFNPFKIIAYDNDEYIQVDFIFNNNDAEQFDLLNEIIDTDQLSQAHPERWIWPMLNIIPHSQFPKNFLELYTINNLIQTTTSEFLVLSCCAAVKEVSLKLDDKEATGFNYKNFENIVEYEILTEEEKAFVKKYASEINSLSFEHLKPSKNPFLNIFKPKSKNENPSSVSSASLVASLHLTEQEKQIFDPEMLTVSIGATDSELALNDLIGLENVKYETTKLKSKLQYRNRQKERGIFITDGSSMHMCFTGAPGTGKTTVARIITGILYNMGYIKENKCIEVNGQNLKGGYQGQTAIITKIVMKSAKNKVLFIDEAYALFDGYQTGYGKEAVAVILKQMEDERDNTVVIFAGYKDDMEEFLTMNDGLKSRINRYIDFRNYSTEELTQILIMSLKKKKLYITEEALGKCVKAFKKAASTERFSNARFVRNLIEKIEYEHAYNTHNTKDITRQDTITVEDVSDDVITELLTHSM